MPEIFISPETKTNKKVLHKMPKKGRHRLFSAFSYCPNDVTFESKEKEEEIVLMLRQHAIVNLKWIFFTIILFLCPPIFQKTGLLSLLPSGYPMVAILTWYLVTVAYAIEGFFSWYFNVFFITTRRVIDVDFFNLIDKRVSDAEIEKIQDVSYSTSGPIGTALNFGSVLIQTAAEITELSFERVPDPEKVAKILDELRAKVH
jgi:hypothetical protein